MVREQHLQAVVPATPEQDAGAGSPGLVGRHRHLPGRLHRIAHGRRADEARRSRYPELAADQREVSPGPSANERGPGRGSTGASAWGRGADHRGDHQHQRQDEQEHVDAGRNSQPRVIQRPPTICTSRSTGHAQGSQSPPLLVVDVGQHGDLRQRGRIGDAARGLFLRSGACVGGVLVRPGDHGVHADLPDDPARRVRPVCSPVTIAAQTPARRHRRTASTPPVRTRTLRDVSS